MRMVRSTGEEIESVGEDGEDRGEGAPGTCGIAGEIDDQGGSDGATDGAAEGGEESFQQAGGAHAFGESVDEAFADEPGGLGGYVAGGEAGASGGDDEVYRGSVVMEGGDDLVELVGNDLGLGGWVCRLR